MFTAPNTDKSAWQTVRFGDVVREVNETEQDPLAKGITRYVGLADLDPDSIQLKRWSEITDGETTFTRLFRKGQMLFGRRRAYQRKAALAPFDGICSGDIIVMEAKPDRLLPELLPFLIHTDGFFNYAIQTSAGSLSPRTKWSHLAKYEFALPPLDEQRRIAEILTAVEEAIECQKRIAHEFEAYRNIILKELLTCGVSSEKGKEELLGGWQFKKIDELCDLTSGNGFRPNDWSQTGLPIIRIQNLNGSMDFNYFSGEPDEKWLVEPGQLLFSWAGVKGISFGPCLWDGPLGVLNQHIYKIHPKKGVEKRWLYEMLKLITTDIEKRAHGFKIELVHVRKADIVGQVVPFPSEQEQKVIVNKAIKLETTSLGQQKHLKKLITLKKKLLNDYLSTYV